jgi:hypothetical protein
MPDSTEIDIALVARLSGDAELQALLPDGVFVNQAKQGKTKFTLVSLVIATDAGNFAAVGTRRAYEDCLYMVKAVTLDASRATAGNAAARIDALLDDQPLTITGYHCASIAREERIDETEVDDLDATIQWQHRGGRYRIVAVPTA